MPDYLKDGRLEPSNNRAERSMKSFVMDRKNFLFADTPSGAKSSAMILSLIQPVLLQNHQNFSTQSQIIENRIGVQSMTEAAMPSKTSPSVMADSSGMASLFSPASVFREARKWRSMSFQPAARMSLPLGCSVNGRCTSPAPTPG